MLVVANYHHPGWKMLVLSRKPNESIVINKDIVITVVAISEGRVKIGIEAPRDIPVNREEVLNRPNGNTR